MRPRTKPRLSCVVQGAALLLLIASSRGSPQRKSVTTFEPQAQVVHVGVSITVFGANLATSDKLVLSEVDPALADSESCGTYNDPPTPVLGTAETHFQLLAPDGGHGVVTVTPQQLAQCWVCVNLFPSTTWIKVQGMFNVTAPEITLVDAAPAPSSISFLSDEASTLRLGGVGLVKGLDRLAFKVFTESCNSLTGVQSEATGLMWANSASDEGLLTLQLQSTSDMSNLVLCSSTNGAAFGLVQDSISLQARSVASFTPTTAVKPSIATTFTFTGARLDAVAQTQLEVMAATQCRSHSEASDIPGGDARTATILSQSQAQATFELGPVLSSIVAIGIDAQGTGYISGFLQASGGGGSGFRGSFTAGPSGIIDQAYVGAPGVGFSSDPLVEAVFPPGSRCGSEQLSDTCKMEGAVTEVIHGTGRTKGCFGGINISAVGDGFGFRAIVSETDVFGQIGAISIVNHGSGYTSPPQLITDDARCQCGDEFVDSEPLAASYKLTTVVGNMDPCFTVGIASGAVLSAVGGWQDHTVQLCARFGSAAWSQIGTNTLSLLSVSAAPSTPAMVASGTPFTVTVTGTGFSSGAFKSRVKLARDCTLTPASDRLGTVIGGEGRPCDSVQEVGGEQECKTAFTTFSTVPLLPLQVCRRIAGGDYAVVPGTSLSVVGMQVSGISPSTAYSTAPYTVTVTGVNIDRVAVETVKVKVCARFVCSGGDGEANEGEACHGLSDARTCFSGAVCVESALCSAQNTSDSAGVISGGDAVRASSLQGCPGVEHSCTEMVFDFTLLSMITVSGELWITSEDGVYEPVPDSLLSVQGSELTALTDVPTTIDSAASFTFSFAGQNLAQDGPGAVNFKFANSSQCDAGGTHSDTSWAILGGVGRNVTDMAGARTARTGTLGFQLMSSREFAATSLCWRIGNMQYRKVQVVDASSNVVVDGWTATVIRSTVAAFTPSDYDTTLGDLALPSFESREIVSITVIGTNFGVDGQSPLRVRPVAMPFALDETAQQCVFADTTVGGQDETCKEFRSVLDAEAGDSSAYCSSGSSVDSIRLVDFAPTTVGDWSGGQQFAIFEVQNTVLIDNVRMMLCWRMSEEDDDLFPWQVVGHVDVRSENQGAIGVVFWSVFVTHTYALTGAYITSIAHTDIVANTPFVLTIEGVGFGCDVADPELLLKVAVANTIQAMVGSEIGGGCNLGSTTDSLGAVQGGSAVAPQCVSLPSDMVTIVQIELTVAVEFTTPLELCWSSTTGARSFRNAFYEGRSALVTFDAAPPRIRRVLINNLPLGEAELMVHVQFSVSLFGEGLTKDGSIAVQLMVAEDCADTATVVPGGEQRGVDCSFGTENATAEFTLLHRSAAAKLCILRAEHTEIWLPHLEGTRAQCQPTYCGAPSCQEDSNFLFDGFSCDTDCCFAKCEADPFCRFWQYFDVVGRVFRKCQTSAHCFDTFVPPDVAITPFVTQKTDGLVHVWQQLGTDLVINPPRVSFATAQQEPLLAPAVPFTVMLEGVAFADMREQVNVKLVDKEQFGGACNDEQLYNETLEAWQNVLDKRESVEAFVASLVNFSYNGTCAGGQRNCVGGPAPPLTVCQINLDCVPALGGSCEDSNNGISCLLDDHCTHGGFCNNSLYNLSITPTPQPPPLQIPFVALDESGSLPGGSGRFQNVENAGLGYVTFTAKAVAEVLICVGVRDPEAEVSYRTEGFITDRRYIVAMASYQPFGTAIIRPPLITEVFPDHVYVHVPTTFEIGGSGLSLAMHIKLVYAGQGCDTSEVRQRDWDTFGAVPGGEGRPLEWVNALGTNASVTLTITEENMGVGVDDNLYLVCYRYVGAAGYERAGHVWVRQRPPIVIGFTPRVVFRNEATEMQLFGSGLGAGQKIKLVHPTAGCRGPNLLTALHDEWGVATDSNAAIVTQIAGKRWVDIEGDRFANETLYARVRATLLVSGSNETDELDLCLKYSDSDIGDVAAGYHRVGSVSVQQQQVDEVLTPHLQAGLTQEIILRGRGIRSREEVVIRMVEAYCQCESLAVDDTCATAGGSGVRVLPSGVTATEVRTEVTIPHGVNASGQICAKFHGRAWSFVGAVEISVEAITAVLIRDGAGNELDEIVAGAPLLVQILTDGVLAGGEIVKLISADEDCQGTDAWAGALHGGHSRTVNGTGFALFNMGVLAVDGLTSTGVRACVLTAGGVAYSAPADARTWPLKPPSAQSIEPRLLRASTATTVQVVGKGLATLARPAWIIIARGTSCSQEGSSWQLHSVDGGFGVVAQARILLPRVGSYAACLSSSDQGEIVKIDDVEVESTAKVLSILPTVWLVGNETAMLLFGSGLGETIQIKWVSVDSDCDGDDFPGGSARGVSSWSPAGTEATTATFTLEGEGSARLCVAEASGADYDDTGIVVSAIQWDPPLLLFPEIAGKTDTQRVEAGMSNVRPACTASWQSDWMFLGPAGYISRDTPAIVNWQDRFRCWETGETVPNTYPQGVGYRPPGEDLRLIEAVRGVPLRVVITGGVGLGDTVFVSRSGCGQDLTQPSKTPTLDAVPGGEAILMTEEMVIDVTSDICGGSQGVSPTVTGSDRRVTGVEIYLTLTEVSKTGQFHRLCVVPQGFAQSLDVAHIDLKVRPPVLLGVEPTVVFSGMRVKFTMHGLGLSPGDEIKVMDGERHRACLGNDKTSTLPGGEAATLGEEETTSFTSAVQLLLTAPSTHARICYRYRGSANWEEMTSRTQLRTSGYVHGYQGNMHFFFGELPTPQGAENRVGGDNQTIAVLAPRAITLRETETVAREALTMTIDGVGLTEDGIYIVVPERVECGGTAVSRVNLVDDGSGSIEPSLRTVEGGQARAPTAVQNDAEQNAMMLRQCTGSDLLGGCQFSAPSTNIVRVPTGFGVSAIGMARVCYRYHRAAEFSEVGVISILPPSLESAAPTTNILLNKPFVLSLKGRSLARTDLIKVVLGISCNAPVSSRPYFLPLNITDAPTNSRAEVLLTLTGPGHHSPGTRKLCYSFDGGTSFVDAGFTLSVVSPTISSIFPTVLSLSAERRIHLYGNAVTEGDRVKVIHASSACQGTDDSEYAVYGGAGRLLDVDVKLPVDPGIQQWPRPVATSGSAVFFLPRTDAAIVCYLHRDSASWEAVPGPDGRPLPLVVVSTAEEALAIQTSSARRRWDRGQGLSVVLLLVTTLISSSR